MIDLQYPPLYDVSVKYFCLEILEYVLYSLNNVTLTFKPYMFIDTKINALTHK